MSNIVGVKFQREGCPGEYFGREYNYRSALDLEVGDVVIVPTVNGDGVAKVLSVDVPESKIDERVMPLLKTIERIYAPEREVPTNE